MRLKLIACKALFRELSYLSAVSENTVDITWIRQGCHDHPEELQALLQKEIDDIEAGIDLHTNRMNANGESSGIAEDFDAILLGYGLCSNATANLCAKSHRLVIPRAHDCVTLFLGSKERYTDYFETLPGCFWYTASWMDSTDMPGKERTERAVKHYQELGYDDEMIDYLLTEIGGLDNYHHAAFISLPVMDHPKYHEATKNAADFFGWEYHDIQGSLSLMERFINGNWNSEEFLVVNPGEKIVPSYDTQVVTKSIGGA